MLDDFSNGVSRTVWKNTNGTNLLTVTGLVQTGDYRVKKYKLGDGKVVLELIPQEDNE